MYKTSNEVRLSPRLLNYQGFITDTLGNPVNDSLDVIFRICDAASAGNILWSELQMEVPVLKGIFHVLLGSVTPISDSIFTKSTSRWLEVRISSQNLTPRTRIVAAPYALTAVYADTADCARTLQGKDTTALDARFVNEGQVNSITAPMIIDTAVTMAKIARAGAATDQIIKWNGTTWAPAVDQVGAGASWSFLVSDIADTTLQTGSRWGLARAGNVLYGAADSTHVNFGVACTTGLSGQDLKYCTVAGGYVNKASGYYSTASGGTRNKAGNAAGNTCATVGGGWDNSASGDFYATVGGGYSNDASGYTAPTVSGGYNNTASNSYTAVGGGQNNTAGYSHATVAGGYNNTAGGIRATVGGGYSNTAINNATTISGGYSNQADSNYSTVGGGYDNTVSGYSSIISGGCYNIISESYATICGGVRDTVKAPYGAALSGYSNVAGSTAADTGAVVCGGINNDAVSKWAFIGGGVNNHSGPACVVGGGGSNYAGLWDVVTGGYCDTAAGGYSSVCGGMNNKATGGYAFIAGGRNNRITSENSYSFAAGYGSLVGDMCDDAAAFNGQTNVTSGATRVGILSKASGSFTIDHPLDPENKILNHYFVESPEMVLIYRGSAVIGADGKATVHLPDYFDALNEAPMIQLTGIKSNDVWVEEKVNGNEFTIGGKPGIEVYWTVTGARKDQSAEITKILLPVEQPKKGSLVGHSLDDDLLVSTKKQLERIGKADGFEFRTADGRKKYENMYTVPEEIDGK